MFAASKSPVRVQPKILATSWGSCTVFICTGRVGDVTWADLDSLAFIQFF
jgi:hypothetical protein